MVREISTQEKEKEVRFQRIAYFIDSFKKLAMLQSKSCPACGSYNTFHLKRKYLCTSLRLCNDCHLMFRYPKDNLFDNIEYYQSLYQEGFTTSLPDEKHIANLINNDFNNSTKDFSNYIAILKSLRRNTGMSLLDFGCSWGYGTYQLKEAGFNAVGFEISEPRADYGRNLGMKIFSNRNKLKEAYPQGFDILFNAHVLEHLPDFYGVFEWFDSLIKPGGLFIAFCPNGNLKRISIIGEKLHEIWGKKHPMLIDSSFLKFHFTRMGWKSRFSSSPFNLEEIKEWPNGAEVVPNKEIGDELLAAAWKPFY